jgi:Glycosyltransferase family 25 (LPS biosynthesis protein)
MGVNNSYCIDVDAAYIITIKGHANSEKLSERCQNSCENVGMPYKVWPAIDGTNKQLNVPDTPHMNWVKIVNDKVSTSEAACALSHYSLWCHCMTIDKPIVILEHDSIMIKPFLTHSHYNCLMYLGGKEQAKMGWGVYPTPPHASLGSTYGKNYHFMNRAHAYSIDPSVARHLVTHLIKYGISDALDITLRADLFGITQTGLYAYDDDNSSSTIVHNSGTP